MYIAIDVEYEQQMELMPLLRAPAKRPNSATRDAPPHEAEAGIPSALSVSKIVAAMPPPPRPAILPPPTSSMDAAALRTTQGETQRIISECQAAAEKPCRDAATFRCPKPDSDDSDVGSGDDDGEGAAGQAGMAYEVTVKYRVV